MGKQPKMERVVFVDNLRGVAVLSMIAWHTTDAWLLPSVRNGLPYDAIRLFGGLAAPMFLFLAGAGVGFSWAKCPKKATSSTLFRRGLQIVALGYGLRLQMWLIDSLAISRVSNTIAWVPMVAGLGLVLWGLSGRRLLRNRWFFCAVGSLLYALGLFQVERFSPDRVVGLLRVDVLQAIGLSLAIAAALAPTLRWEKRGWLAICVGMLVALYTPWLQSQMPWIFPESIAGYIARWHTLAELSLANGMESIAGYIARWHTPIGTKPVGMFPLFPWFGYALTGVGVGTIWLDGVRANRLTRHVILLAIAGAVIAITSSEYRPLVYQTLRDHPDLTQLFRMAYRIGLVLMMSLFVYWIPQNGVSKYLTRLGQTSLVVYWVHLEFAFGLAAQPLRNSLTLTTWFVAFCVLSIAMFTLATKIRSRNPR